MMIVRCHLCTNTSMGHRHELDRAGWKRHNKTWTCPTCSTTKNPTQPTTHPPTKGHPPCQ